MMTLKIAFRNIFRQRRRTVLTMLTMIGGFSLAAVSIGWSDGTYSNVINMFTRNQLGHIQIHHQGYLERRSIHKTIDNYNLVGAELDTLNGVVAWSPRMYAAGLASVGEKSSAARIIGVDPAKESRATRFDRKVIGGSSFAPAPSNQAILGEGLATRLEADVGDELVVVSQAADGSIANDLYTVIGISSGGDRISDQTSLYLHLDDAQELFVLDDRIHEIAVVAHDLDIVDDLTRKIQVALHDSALEAASWKEFAHSFYTAMKADQQGAWIMLLVIMLVVAVGVLNTVLMTVLERRREYGVLRAIGTAPAQVFRLVLLEVLIMAAFSLIIGSGVAYVVNYILSIYGIELPHAFTYGGIEFTAMYAEINWRSFYLPAACVLFTAAVVSVFPAARAARIRPAKAMRLH
jgi:ABC-type lipoprotein release transport system permease subunit